MDFILQQDANKKAGRKRKKQTGGTSADAATAAGSTGGSTAPSDNITTDPAVAAAALRAFGGVVDLCCIAGCRRQRLLSHFGETLSASQQRQQQGARCCDYCDNAGRVEAAVQQLQEFEQQMVQSRYNGGAARGGKGAVNKRRKAGGDGYAALGFGSYSDEDEDEEAAGSGRITNNSIPN